MNENEQGFRYYQFFRYDNEKEFQECQDFVEDNRMFETGGILRYGDRVWMLFTCEYSQVNGRLVVVAKKIKKYVNQLSSNRENIGKSVLYMISQIMEAWKRLWRQAKLGMDDKHDFLLDSFRNTRISEHRQETGRDSKSGSSRTRNRKEVVRKTREKTGLKTASACDIV